MGVEEVAGYLGLCRSQLFRVVKAASGLSPGNGSRRARLQRAAQLLEDGRLSLEQVALSCGYGGAAQLGQAFRKAYGQTPLAYRRACHGGPSAPRDPTPAPGRGMNGPRRPPGTGPPPGVRRETRRGASKGPRFTKGAGKNQAAYTTRKPRRAGSFPRPACYKATNPQTQGPGPTPPGAKALVLQKG